MPVCHFTVHLVEKKIKISLDTCTAVTSEAVLKRHPYILTKGSMDFPFSQAEVFSLKKHNLLRNNVLL